MRGQNKSRYATGASLLAFKASNSSAERSRAKVGLVDALCCSALVGVVFRIGMIVDPGFRARHNRGARIYNRRDGYKQPSVQCYSNTWSG